MYLTWKGEHYDEDIQLKCKPDSSNNNKAICLGRIYEKGEYYLNVSEIEFKELIVTAKDVPSLINYSPISILPSSNSTSIILYFEEDISSYVNKITFVGAETLTPTCELSSNYALICTAVFKNEDKYFINIDGANIGRFINVNEEDNKNIDIDNDNDNDESENNDITDNDESENNDNDITDNDESENNDNNITDNDESENNDSSSNGNDSCCYANYINKIKYISLLLVLLL